MARKLEWVLLAVAFAIPAYAGTISGTVRNSSGIAQMGATVEIFASSPVPIATVFTDTTGFYSAKDLLPGSYFVRVSAPSFLPAMREDVGLKSGANLIVNVTLNTLFEAMQWMPTRGRTPADDEDWKWTLRSMTGRPVLRVVDDGPLVVVSKEENDKERVLKARVAFLAGNEAEGFGSAGDMTTTFNVEKSLFAAGTLSVNGNVGYGAGSTPGTVLRASYSHKVGNGSEPKLTVTARRFATPDMVAHNAALQALAISLADNFTLADFIDFSFGSEYQTIQYQGHVAAYKPFGSADIHLSPNTVVEYQYATSVPNTRHQKGFDSAPADLSESGPRMTLRDNTATLERARHHEVSLSRRIGKNNVQAAWYADHIANPALVGLGAVTADTGEFLPDFYSGTFTYGGRDLDTSGIRVVFQRKLVSDLTATLDYSYGGVLQMAQANADISAVRDLMKNERRNSLALKFNGSLPGSHTRWLASYKWNGAMTLTPVDLFNTSAGQADPYFNIFVRQPIPGMGFMPCHMEALVDVRNLLAQGYVPVVGQDGRTLYLVQSARSVRGGIAFTF